jgi:hypothetical protein
MHPVARISIKYWNNLRKQQSIFSARFYCALLTLQVLASFGGHLHNITRNFIKIIRNLRVGILQQDIHEDTTG